jgi:membrane-associated phospholipid phosphatase
MPSLHCAYAFIVALEGWAVFRPAWRAASVAFFVLMCFSAVYLDHHWVLDALGGVLYCLVVVGTARALTRTRAAGAGPAMHGRAAEASSPNGPGQAP